MSRPRTPRRTAPRAALSWAGATPPNASLREATDGEAWYRAVFDQAAVGIARVAPDGAFLEVNDRFCEIVGCPRERLVRGDFQTITHPDDLAGNPRSQLRYRLPELRQRRCSAGQPSPNESILSDDCQ